MTAQATPRTRKPRNQKDAPPQPRVTDAQYTELLAIRLAAMHGFDDGTVDAATKNQARAAVRQARKVRKEDAEVNATWNAYQEKLAAEKEAAKSARPKRSRAKKATVPATEPTAEATQTDADPVPNPADVAA